MANGGIKFVWPAISLGWVIALIILILCIVGMVFGKFGGLEVWLIAGLALARLT